MSSSTKALAAIITIALTIPAVIYFRADIIALNQSEGWLGFGVTVGACLVVAVALAVLVSVILPDEIKDQLKRGWL